MTTEHTSNRHPTIFDAAQMLDDRGYTHRRIADVPGTYHEHEVDDVSESLVIRTGSGLVTIDLHPDGTTRSINSIEELVELIGGLPDERVVAHEDLPRP